MEESIPIHSLCLLIKFVAIFSFLSAHESSGNILLHPTSQEATLNSTVVLRCRVKVVPGMTVSWIKDNFGMGYTREDIRAYGMNKKTNISRYDLIKNADRGEYDLKIQRVGLADDAVFKCQTQLGGKPLPSKPANLTVLVPSLPGRLIQVHQSATKSVVNLSSPAVGLEGKNLTLLCVALYGKPGAIINWYIDNNKVVANSLKKFQTRTVRGLVENSVYPDGKHHRKLRNSVGKLTILNVTRLYQNKEVECRTTNKGYEHLTQKPAKTYLDVYYRPIVTLQVEPEKSKNEYKEFETVKFMCAAIGNPSGFYWEWYVNDRLIPNIVESWYKVVITRDLHKARLKCVARNSYDEGVANINIYVKYGPQFRESSVLMYPASAGDDVTMSCEVDSNPTATVVWSFEGSRTVIHEGILITIYNTREADFRAYVCTAKVPGFPSISKNMYIAKRDEPRISPGEVVHAKLGQPINLKCRIYSVPAPSKSQITWTKGNSLVLTHNKRRTHDVKEILGGVVSILFIAKVTNKDLGKYNCTAINKYGSDSEMIQLVLKSNIPVAYIAGGVLTVVLFILILVLIICGCRKSRCSHKYQKAGSCEPGIISNGHNQQSSNLELSPNNLGPTYYGWSLPDADIGFQPYAERVRTVSFGNGSLSRYRPTDVSSNGTEKMMLQINEEELSQPINLTQSVGSSLHSHNLMSASVIRDMQGTSSASQVPLITSLPRVSHPQPNLTVQPHHSITSLMSNPSPLPQPQTWNLSDTNPNVRINSYQSEH